MFQDSKPLISVYCINWLWNISRKFLRVCWRELAPVCCHFSCDNKMNPKNQQNHRLFPKNDWSRDISPTFYRFFPEPVCYVVLVQWLRGLLETQPAAGATDTCIERSLVSRSSKNFSKDFSRFRALLVAKKQQRRDVFFFGAESDD